MAWIKAIKTPPYPTMPPFDTTKFTYTASGSGGSIPDGFVIDNDSLKIEIYSWAWGAQNGTTIEYTEPINVSHASTMHISGERIIRTSTDTGGAQISIQLQYSSDGVTYTDATAIIVINISASGIDLSYNTDVDISSYNYIKVKLQYQQYTSDQNNNKLVSYYLHGISFS